MQRFLCKMGDLLSPDLHGFMKGRSTANCFIKCVNRDNVTCRAFIDTIMEELTVKDVTGRLLGQIKDYLYARKAKVWGQGALKIL